MTFVRYERPVRAAFVGLGRIYDLNVRGYVGNPDVEVVALVDPSPERRAQRQADWPAARTFASAAELASSGLAVDAVEALLPVGLHADGVVELLGFGWHVNLQKPICGELPDAQRMLDAAKASGAILRVMENYLFYEPLRKLKATIESGQIGDVAGYHLKMVGSGNGGWDVPWSSFELQMEQMKRGRGIFVFDDGWHKLSTAIWLFGPVREVRAWIGNTAVGPGIDLDAPTTIMWEHDNGVRGVWDITLAMDMYLRSDYYTNDERWEITGSKGYARVNRCTGRGIQQPSLEVYADGELRGYHALDDDWASSFRDSGRHWLRWLRTGEGPLLWSGEEAADVLRFALAGYASSASGGLGVNPRQVGLGRRSRSLVPGRPTWAPMSAGCHTGHMPVNTRCVAVLAGTALLGIGLDQATKALVVATVEGKPPIRVIGAVLSIYVSRNSGAAFSFAPAATVLFTCLAVAIAMLILTKMLRLRSVGWAVTLGLLLAGAVGNLCDRLLRAPGVGRGAVVDFIDLQHFANFNIADSCLTCGVVLAVLLTLRGVPMTGRSPELAGQPES